MNTSAQKVKAMVFAAGLGTRLRPWTLTHPKALVPVAGKPLLQHTVEYLRKFGITDLIVNVHHFPDQIIRAVEENAGWGSRITISDEREEVLETGGGLKKAASILQDSDLLITINADILTDLDLNILMARHIQNNALISPAVSRRAGSRKLICDGNMRLCGWQNTATGEKRIAIEVENTEDFSFSGITVMDPRVFSLMTKTGKFGLIELFLELAPLHHIMCYDHSGGLFLDVGKPESLEQANALFGG